MCLVKRALIVAVLAALSIGPHAVAGTATGCRPLIKDPSGDALEHYLPTKRNRADLDITSVSVTNDRSSLRLTTRVAHLAAPQPIGGIYSVFFRVHGFPYVAEAYRGLDETTFLLAVDNRFGDRPSWPIAGTVDQKTRSVTVVVPLALIGSPRAGARIDGISAVSSESMGTSTVAVVGRTDETSQGHVSVLNRPACGSP